MADVKLRGVGELEVLIARERRERDRYQAEADSYDSEIEKLEEELRQQHCRYPRTRWEATMVEMMRLPRLRLEADMLGLIPWATE